MNNFVKIFLFSCSLTQVSVASQFDDHNGGIHHEFIVRIVFKNQQGQEVTSGVKWFDTQKITGESLIRSISIEWGRDNKFQDLYGRGFDVFFDGEKVDKDSYYEVTRNSKIDVKARNTFEEPRKLMNIIFSFILGKDAISNGVEIDKYFARTPERVRGSELFDRIHAYLHKKIGKPVTFKIIVINADGSQIVNDSNDDIYNLEGSIGAYVVISKNQSNPNGN